MWFWCFTGMESRKSIQVLERIHIIYPVSLFEIGMGVHFQEIIMDILRYLIHVLLY
jgi:hypothetical protein